MNAMNAKFSFFYPAHVLPKPTDCLPPEPLQNRQKVSRVGTSFRDFLIILNAATVWNV